ncbi:OmpA family protein [Gammaproteobacteria bacterium]|nr:OmpA family protein [Gammaproteobacteria bacterium]
MSNSKNAKGWLWLAIIALIVLAIWIWFCVKRDSVRVENIVRKDVSSVLSARSYAVPEVGVDGRFVTLSGEVDRRVNVEDMRQALDDLPSVERVITKVTHRAAQSARVDISGDGQAIIVQGLIGSTEQHDQVMAAARDAFGADIEDQLVVSESVSAEPWVSAMAGWLPGMSALRDPVIEADRGQIRVSGRVDSEDAANAVVNRIESAQSSDQSLSHNLNVLASERSASLAISIGDVGVKLEGELPNESLRKRLLEEGTDVFAGRAFDADGLNVVSSVGDPEWARQTMLLMAEVEGLRSGSRLDIDDGGIVISGEVYSDVEKARIGERVRSASAGHPVDNLLRVVDGDQPLSLAIDFSDRDVSLSGTLPSQSAVDALGRTAAELSQVGRINNSLEVDSSQRALNSPDDLTALIDGLWGSQAPQLSIDGGVLRIVATVASEAERDSLLDDATALAEANGLRVDDGITVSASAALGEALVAAPSDEDVAAAQDRLSQLDLPTLEFVTNEATLTPVSRQRIAGLIELMRSYPTLRIEVIGHTDSVGDAEFNRALSQRRAEAIKGVLVESGINAGRVVATGRGETQPVADNTTASGRQRNRRIETRIVTQ